MGDGFSAVFGAELAVEGSLVVRGTNTWVVRWLTVALQFKRICEESAAANRMSLSPLPAPGQLGYCLRTWSDRCRAPGVWVAADDCDAPRRTHGSFAVDYCHGRRPPTHCTIPGWFNGE